ncbi:MAG: hypothetical protein ABIN94_05670 [Ferruginibacter sp.]
MLRYIIFILSVVSCPLVFSQTINGKIENAYGEKIPLANVIVKDSANFGRAINFVIARNGQYTISLKEPVQTIVIEVAANKYVKEYSIIRNLVKDALYTADFALHKDESLDLKEVIVKAKTKAFLITNDTVKYNVAAYKDGSERKIEDIIKKLPGIEVNESTGVISYKGKTVETVKLEGDDLFGANYTIGTKNINVDMVEQVQAIENYSDNPLLKGIENGNKVALNLKLKKGKFEFSGDMDVGSGVSAEGKLMQNTGSNVLGISKNFKSFGTLSYNNVGINNSPFDYFSYSPGNEQIKEADLSAKKVLPETIYSSPLDEKRANINNSLFGNYNHLFKIAERLSIKTNLFYIHDKLSSQQFFANNNLINGRQILTSDQYNIEKRPAQYRGDVEIKYNASKNALFEYKLRLNKELINTITSVVQNNAIPYNTRLETKEFRFAESLIFTQRFSEKKAFQVFLNHSSDDIPQNYWLHPSVYDPVAYITDNQFSNFKKKMLSVQSVLLGSAEKTKYTFSIGYKVEENPYQSKLTSNNNIASVTHPGFANDLVYKKAVLYNSVAMHFVSGKWKLSPSYTLSYVNQNLINQLLTKTEKKENTIIDPAFSLKYKFNNESALLATINYTQTSSSEEYLFNNPVYISNRLTTRNYPGLQLQKTTFIGGYYLINNLYKQFQLNVGVNYFRRGGGYIPNIYIRENSTGTEYFYLPIPNKNLALDFSIEKYISTLESTLRWKSSYSILNYKNIVNGSAIRNNDSRFFSAEFFMKTAFDIDINFENIMRYKKIRSQSEHSEVFINEAINDVFKIIVKPNKHWFILLSSDYFLPNFKKEKHEYFFLDATIRFIKKSKRIEVNLTGKNILNNRLFTQVETTDYSKNLLQSNLIPGYGMINIMYNF